MKREPLIQSLFHRRLVLLAVVMMAVNLVLGAQLTRLSVLQGPERRARAESILDRRTYLPTYRGRILDRNGLVLARDRPSYGIAVDYEVITGQWVLAQAARQARRDLGRSAWNAMSPEERRAARTARTDLWDARRREMMQYLIRLGGIDADELRRRFTSIEEEVEALAVVVWRRQRAGERLLYGEDRDFTPRPILEQTDAHVVLPNVSDEVAFEFRRLAHRWPGMIEVQDSRRREYPWSSVEVTLDRSSLPRSLRRDTPALVRIEGVADHLLGSMRNDVWAEDIRRRAFRDPDTGAVDLGGYRLRDSVGARGLEQSFEDELRGLRGVIDERRDTGETRRTPPVPGRDLQLTLDIALQARVQAILSPQFGLCRVQDWHDHSYLSPGTPLNGAAVVVEVATGDVLAMVSMPTLTMGATMTDDEAFIASPVVDRPAEGIYPPGSIIKPIALVSAMTEGAIHAGDAVECTGHFFEHDQDHARCWIYRARYNFATHGTLGAEEAIARSCNIFFYTVADRLGLERLMDWYGQFGLGRRLAVGRRATDVHGSAFGVHAGVLPDADTMAKWRAEGRARFATISMGIGQGPIAWTPLQAANAYAQMARNGIVRDATLLRDEPRGTPPPERPERPLSPEAVRLALEGLRQSVTEYHGTGHHITYGTNDWDPVIDAPAVTVWAKTGTAEAPPLKDRDTNGDGVVNRDDEGEPDLDHAWFVGLVGPRDPATPMYAVAVILEYGGSGGRVAGPVANQVIRALQAEGYLPGDAR